MKSKYLLVIAFLVMLLLTFTFVSNQIENADQNLPCAIGDDDDDFSNDDGNSKEGIYVLSVQSSN